MSSLTEARAELAKFRKLERREYKKLEELSLDAEETGDYSDYDEARFDTFEFLADAASQLADRLEFLLAPEPNGVRN